MLVRRRGIPEVGVAGSEVGVGHQRMCLYRLISMIFSFPTGERGRQTGVENVIVKRHDIRLRLQQEMIPTINHQLRFLKPNQSTGSERERRRGREGESKRTHLKVSANMKDSILSPYRYSSFVTSTMDDIPPETLATLIQETNIFHPFSCHFRSPVSRYLGVDHHSSAQDSRNTFQSQRQKLTTVKKVNLNRHVEDRFDSFRPIDAPPNDLLRPRWTPTQSLNIFLLMTFPKFSFTGELDRFPIFIPPQHTIPIRVYQRGIDRFLT